MITPSATPDLPVAIGQYRILCPLGEGGCGTVYKAEHERLKCTVAVKTLVRRQLKNAYAIERFRREMEAIGRLRHPNIVRATDAGEADGLPYLVMEYIDGCDLGRLLKLLGPFSVPDACEIARQAAEALTCVEAHGLVHRDIKPSNLLLGRDGVVRLLDLGLARFHDTPAGREPLTYTGALMGTGDFIAPEQALESRSVDIRADIYSLGCTLYAMLAGSPPYAGDEYDSFLKKLKAHVETPAPALEERRAGLEPSLNILVKAMLMKAPADRPTSPREVASRLTPFCTGHNLPQMLANFQPAESPRVCSDRMPAADSTASVPQTAGELPLPAGRRHSWRQPWPWTPLLLFLALVPAVLLATGVVHRLNRAGRPEGGTVTNSLEKETSNPVYQPGVWYDLLEHSPRPLSWPAANSWWDYRKAEHELRLDCSATGLLTLATVPDESHGFEMELSFVQNPWSGGVGVYFRGREKAHDVVDMTADAIVLQHIRFEDRTDVARINRTRLQRSTSSGHISANPVDTTTILRPRVGEHRVVLHVGKKGLQKMSWDDAKVDLRPEESEVAAREGAGGQVGVFMEVGSAVIRTARIKLLPEPETKP
jgi:serine/threonine protein kinase